MRLAHPLLHLSKSSLLRMLPAMISLAVASVASPVIAQSVRGYGDGTIEKVEPITGTSTARTESFRGLDRNRDGFISRVEMRDSPRLAAWRVIDRNRDGKVSAREYSDFRAHRERNIDLDSAGATEITDYGDPYLNARLRKSTATVKRGSGDTATGSESHYEEVLRQSNLERERRTNPAGYR